MKIERGATRIVFIFNKFVIKIPNTQEYRLFLHGQLANMQEKTFSKIGREDLAKVYYGGRLGLLLIMERVQAIDLQQEYDNDFCETFYDMLHKKYKDDDLEEFMLSDLKATNWGYRNNGMLVKLDYGN